MVRSKKIIYLIAGLILVNGCSEKKIPIKGKRESFIITSEETKPDPLLKSKLVQVKNIINNKEWHQSGYNSMHQMGSFKIADKLKLSWNKSIGKGTNTYQRITCGPIVAQGIVYVADANGTISALQLSDGKGLWTLKTTTKDDKAEDAMGCGLGYEDGQLYAVSSFGRVFAINSKNGKILWESNTGIPVRGAPTIKDGKIYIINVNNEIIALENKNGNIIWTHGGIVEPASLLGTSSPAVDQELVIAGFSSGEVYALQKDTGYAIWSETMTAASTIYTASSIAHIKAKPIIDGDYAYLISHGGKTSCFNVKTGETIWQKDIGGVRTPIISGEFMFILTNENELVCLLKENGKTCWSTKLPEKDKENSPLKWSGPILANNKIVIANNGLVLFIDAQNGKKLDELTYNNKSFVQISPIIADGKLILITNDANIFVWN